MARIIRPVLIAAVALGVVWLSFELGRYEAGFSLLDSRRTETVHAAELAGRDQQIDDLERQIAIYETSGQIDRETYASVEENLAELQARIQSQEEELAFYRGIVTPGDGVAGLRIQNVEVVAGDEAPGQVLRILLVQAIVHNDRVTGSVRATVSGMLNGEAAEFGLDELGSENGATDIPYGFRYFQTLELGITLPEGFEPGEIEVQVWPGSPRGETIVESFAWSEVAE